MTDKLERFCQSYIGVRPSVCLSVRHTRELWQNERNFCQNSTNEISSRRGSREVSTQVFRYVS